MSPAYIDEEVFAIGNDYATWLLYAADNPETPILSHLTELIEEATEIINENIGSFNTNISDSRFLSRVEKLCLRMVKRMRQVETGQGMSGKIPMFSPNDFLIERERINLHNIGKILKFRKVGKLVF